MLILVQQQMMDVAVVTTLYNMYNIIHHAMSNICSFGILNRVNKS